MKQICLQCGCHFPEDFEETLRPPCNYWGAHGVSNLPVPEKRRIWDWLFSMPSDSISIEFKTALLLKWEGQPVIEGAQFEEIVPNWKELSEPERKAYQKKFFKKQFYEQGEKQEPAKRSN